jgi:hypothetical protein
MRRVEEGSLGVATRIDLDHLLGRALKERSSDWTVKSAMPTKPIDFLETKFERPKFEGGRSKRLPKKWTPWAIGAKPMEESAATGQVTLLDQGREWRPGKGVGCSGSSSP